MRLKIDKTDWRVLPILAIPLILQFLWGREYFALPIFPFDSGYRTTNCMSSFAFFDGIGEGIMNSILCTISLSSIFHKYLLVLVTWLILCTLFFVIKRRVGSRCASWGVLVFASHPMIAVHSSSSAVLVGCLFAVLLLISNDENPNPILIILTSVLSPILGLMNATKARWGLLGLGTSVLVLGISLILGSSRFSHLENYLTTLTRFPATELIILLFTILVTQKHIEIREQIRMDWRTPVLLIIVGHLLRDADGFSSLALGPSLFLWLWASLTFVLWLDKQERNKKGIVMSVMAIFLVIGVYQTTRDRFVRSNWNWVSIGRTIRTLPAPCSIGTDYPGIAEWSDCEVFESASNVTTTYMLIRPSRSFAVSDPTGVQRLLGGVALRDGWPNIDAILITCAQAGEITFVEPIGIECP